MGTIVTIGGDDSGSKKTLAIDKEILRLSGKKRPRALFIPTARSDSRAYWLSMRRYYGDYLGCEMDVLFLLDKNPDKSEIRKKIAAADIIYVGGGNTLKMMRRFRHLGVDTMLKAAYEKGTVLCGVSAGSICWYEYGHSDSLSYYHPKDWKYIRVRGLGFIRGTHCPHYDSHTRGVPRKKSFQDMIAEKSGDGIAVDDNCAIIYSGNGYRVIHSKPGAGAYRVYKKRGKAHSEKIEEKAQYSPVKELYS